MSIKGRCEKALMWTAFVPLAILALACLYPIYFALNNALKTNKG